MILLNLKMGFKGVHMAALEVRKANEERATVMLL